jgi:hypothetical protein
VQKIVALYQLIGEFGKRHAIAGFTGQAFLHRILGHHIVHCDMLTHVADKAEERKLLHPVVVIYQFSLVWCVGFKIEQFHQLGFQTFLVVTQGGFVEQVAFFRFSRRITDHTGSTTNQHNGFVPALLKMLQHHYTNKMANMKGVGSRINAHVGRYHFFLQYLFGTGHNGMHHTAPGQFFNKIHGLLFSAKLRLSGELTKKGRYLIQDHFRHRIKKQI